MICSSVKRLRLMSWSSQGDRTNFKLDYLRGKRQRKSNQTYSFLQMEDATAVRRANASVLEQHDRWAMPKPFRSKFKDNDKLKDCADRDSSNIWERNNRSGAHVGLIHEALNAWLNGQPIQNRPAGIAASEIRQQVYGPTTSALVLAYKTANQIKNYKGEYDPIVGKKTVESLDGQLPVKPDGDDKDKDKKQDKTRLLDVVVQFHGIRPTDPKAGKETMDDVFGNVAAFNAAAAKHGKPRDLIVINMYGKPGNDAVDEGEKLFRARTAGRQVGMLIVAGSSIGGKNAAAFIHRTKGMPLRYAAFLDAAFDGPTDTLLKTKIDADEAISAFQTMTFGWADLLGTPEYHGTILGTKPRDVTNSTANGAKNRSTQGSIDILRQNWFLPARAKYAIAQYHEKHVHDRAVEDGWGIAGIRIIEIIEQAP